MSMRLLSRLHWLLLAALFAVLLRPDAVEAGWSCRLALVLTTDGEKDRDPECLTLLVRGMMKSKSGAT